MQKKLKRKDRGRGRGGNKGSDGFHEVPAIPILFPAILPAIPIQSNCAGDAISASPVP